MLLDSAPTFWVIFVMVGRTVVCQFEGVVALKHECEVVLIRRHGLELCIAALLKYGCLWPVSNHMAVQRGTTRQKALLLCLVDTSDVTHKLAHAVLVIVRRAEGVFCNHPAGWEDDKVARRNSRLCRLRRENAEDAGIQMVKGYRVDHAKLGKIISVGRVVSMPSDDIEGTVVLFKCKHLIAVLREAREGNITVFVPRHGGLKVPLVCQTIAANHTARGKLKVLIKRLSDVPASTCARDIH
mmetsp:Transcript_32843/g.38091  ORF Transcript_32843/g.38091 Transcript_32843/m.38091 type:complete len:241 (+) Transcript_32843:424-1146(+)